MPRADEEREREFDENESDPWGWDGYHVEDGVAFARFFRAQRDEARAFHEVTASALQDADKEIAALRAQLRAAESELPGIIERAYREGFRAASTTGQWDSEWESGEWLCSYARSSLARPASPAEEGPQT